MTDLIPALARAKDEEGVFETVAQFFRDDGFNAFCYVVPSALNPSRLDVRNFGFPHGWMERYEAEEFDLVDPIPGYAMRTGRSFLWSDVEQEVEIAPAQARYLAEMRAALVDGVALPTFGRYRRMAYFGVGCANHLSLSDFEMMMLHAGAQQAHIRLDQLAEQRIPQQALSSRETEILHWIAQGKSNADLAAIIGISPATAATYIRRLFTKLGVNDRVAAIVTALQRNLINI